MADSCLRGIYRVGGRRPWSLGYLQHRQKVLHAISTDDRTLECFRDGGSLPTGYGRYLDERIVEYPWLFARLPATESLLLDAGSVLNHDWIMEHPVLQKKQVHILTLAPEPFCFWRRRISYCFDDLRSIPYRDDLFDEVICISTLEHIGSDNTMYWQAAAGMARDDLGFKLAAVELLRVAKPGGRIYVTVPFGKRVDYGYYQQFDAERLGALISAFAGFAINQTFFRYTDRGWRFANRAECEECLAFDIHAARRRRCHGRIAYDADFAACSRAIAALEIRK